MSPARPSSSGYSLIELLVVLAIVTILAVAGVTMIGNRQAGAVRGLLDEMEGALGNAHKVAVATGRDVAIVTWGAWGDSTLRMAIGDASLTDAQIQATATNLLLSIPPDAALGPPGQTVAVPFRALPNDTIQTRARVVMLASAQWTNSMMAAPNGATNEDIAVVPPFSTPTMAGLLVDGNHLFPGGLNRVTISGSNKRFNNAFIIPIVGTTAAGGAVPGGPMGLIVVQANGGSIYRFYNPGAKDSDGRWRRI